MQIQKEKQDLENDRKEAENRVQAAIDRENQRQLEEKEHRQQIGNEPTEAEETENHIFPQHQDNYLTTTTTTRPTKRRPNKQDPICKLPPDPESDVEFDAGYRFGTAIDSRIEFAEVPVKIKKSYEISLEFKTDKPDGVLFYAADSRHTDFIVLYLQNGYVSDKFCHHI